jgi:uncharacterized protein with PQ loop repeat
MGAVEDTLSTGKMQLRKIHCIATRSLDLNAWTILVTAYFSFLFSDIILNKLASVLSISEPLSKNLKQTQRGLLYCKTLFFSL